MSVHHDVTASELGMECLVNRVYGYQAGSVGIRVPPDSGQITNARAIEAVVRYCLDSGSTRVIIGEGPSYYQPESRLKACFTRTGVSEVADRLGVEWVLFDEHSYRTFKGVSDFMPDEFRVTEFAFTCDKVIKNSAGYPSACWREESGSPQGEARAFA